MHGCCAADNTTENNNTGYMMLTEDTSRKMPIDGRAVFQSANLVDERIGSWMFPTLGMVLGCGSHRAIRGGALRSVKISSIGAGPADE